MFFLSECPPFSPLSITPSSHHQPRLSTNQTFKEIHVQFKALAWRNSFLIFHLYHSSDPSVYPALSNLSYTHALHTQKKKKYFMSERRVLFTVIQWWISSTCFSSLKKLQGISWKGSNELEKEKEKKIIPNIISIT